MGPCDLQDLLGVALAFEGKTAEFYRRVLGTVTEEKRHALIAGLLRAEESHIRQLTDFQKKLTQEAFYPVRPEMPWPQEVDELDFSVLSFTEIIEAALTIEKTGLRFYQSMIDAAPNAVIKDFFTALANFEHSHVDLLTQEKIRS
jgi:rubrerythrin